MPWTKTTVQWSYMRFRGRLASSATDRLMHEDGVVTARCSFPIEPQVMLGRQKLPDAVPSYALLAE